MSGTLQVLGQVLGAVISVAVVAGLLVWSLRRDPRSLRNGFLLLLTVHYVLGLLAVLVATSSALEWAADVVGLVVLAVVGLGLMLLPFLLLVDGVLMVRRERRTLGNALSLLVGLALLALPVVLVLLLRHENPVTGSVAVGLLTAQACMSLLFLVFAVHTALYARVARRAPARAVIVLGSGLVRGAVPPLLAGRLRRAVAAARDRSGRDGVPVLVPSGGRGADEPVAEGVAMAAWLGEHGVRAEDVLVEDRARTTRENLLLSVALLERHGVRPPYLVVTNDYHAPRAAMLARRLGIDAQAVGAPTALYYWPSAYLREFVAVMREQRALLAVSGLAVVTMATLTWLSLTAR
ncbi:YdcF family protein [Aeromicrobium sp. IC_218]|uniref:YdcF family protein n=1 Tax=Aeromicrobium sp. IC_218 TaxID=2545468 RepID=UPI00103F6F38|nr:YdcF family protein [Aeromicrobium sp. IC_218]TCJ00840.1 YdcF family protein [Aeromicrobium sp. IC_218]